MTALHPVSLSLTLILAALLLAVPRRWAMAPLVVAAVFVPVDQRLILGGLDFTVLRILALAGCVRIVVRGEAAGLRLHRIDWLLFAFTGVVVLAYTVREQSINALINRLGWGFDAIGVYFYARASIRSTADVFSTVRVAIPCTGALALAMGIEWMTGRNLFSVIGGVPAQTVIRDGRLRAQGAFAHPIMAGLFGASWAPIFAALWFYGRRSDAVIGLAAAFAAAVFSSSSTPLASMIFGLVGLFLWRYRAYTRYARYIAAGLLLILHFAREKPVWQLIARANLVGGSTGWYRYYLIDNAIKNFDDWWLIGTSDTGLWGMFLTDITNEYLLAGVRGGFLALALFVALIAFSFGGLGTAARNRRLPFASRYMSWALGCMLTVHATAFVSVSYFGQMRAIWYIQLALIAHAIDRSYRARTSRSGPRRARQPDRARDGEPGADAAPRSLGRALRG